MKVISAGNLEVVVVREAAVVVQEAVVVRLVVVDLAASRATW